MSKEYPFSLNNLALPPTDSFFSNIVTSNPSFAKKAAELKPEKPLPIIEIFFIFLTAIQI